MPQIFDLQCRQFDAFRQIEINPMDPISGPNIDNSAAPNFYNPIKTKLPKLPQISEYMGFFDSKSSPETLKISHQPRGLKDLIVVFKKKNFPVANLKNYARIYNDSPKDVELDITDSSKSRQSCLRCRKFKKRCTRDLPECNNCSSCEELCIYQPRKRSQPVRTSGGATTSAPLTPSKDSPLKMSPVSPCSSDDTCYSKSYRKLSLPLPATPRLGISDIRSLLN